MNGALNLQAMAMMIGKAAPVILEIGCNDGTDTERMKAAFGPQAIIHCFEPEARARARFRVTNVTLWPMAIGAVNDWLEFYSSDGLPGPLPAPEAAAIASKLPYGWDLSGSIRKPLNHVYRHPWCTFKQPVSVPVRRLDTWAGDQHIGAVDFIWADVQGAEVDLIAGGLDTLARTRYFYTEYSNDEMYEGQITLPELLERLPNFELVAQYPEDVLLRNTAL